MEKPEILAPAGDEDCFLAALAAGADAVYLGLKRFSARMEADNFGLAQLARLAELAHANGRRVYVAMNSMLRPDELESAYRLVLRLERQAGADGLIIQDLGMLDLARQAGFSGMIAFSTLANAGNPAALAQADAFGADRVIIPRELSLEEMRLMGDACPPGLKLECFVHGALCYCVSGRCYWSSYLGGKSGLRGRCVQPCRRNYARQGRGRSGASRLFSCQDLELGASVQALLSVPNLVSWKIEGRKKGPHYVFHAVTAYRMLRDAGEDAKARDEALEILGQALGRPGVKAGFSRKIQPMAPGRQTSSGLLAGKVVISQAGEPFLRPRFDLLPKDYLRVGVEDERWHATLPVRRGVPRGGAWRLPLERHKTPKAGTPVFLIDRREKGLEQVLAEWRRKLKAMPERKLESVDASPGLPRPARPELMPDMLVSRGRLQGQQGKRRFLRGVWLDAGALKMPRQAALSATFWLPPDLWPENEPAIRAIVDQLWRRGARRFVLNSPWQRALFPQSLPDGADLCAGPFCNIANGCAVAELARAGFRSAFASPELGAKDLLALPGQSPLPLGLVISGWWPVGISRFGLSGIDAGEAFKSPHGETFWSRSHGGSIWIYPGWRLDLEAKREELLKAGYSFFAVLLEKQPDLPEAKRPGLFNWDGTLL